MRTLLPGTAAYIAGPTLGLVSLVRMQFSSGTIALNTSNSPHDWGGDTYVGASALTALAEVLDGPGEIKGLSFTLSGIDSAYLALALDDAAMVQGTPLILRVGIVGAYNVLIDAPIVWAGTLDTMSIQEDGDTCTIQVTAEGASVDLLRGAAYTYNDGDQRALYPGDRAFEYVTPQSDKPVVWPNAQWAIARGPR